MTETVKNGFLTTLAAVETSALGALEDGRQLHVFDRLSWLRLVWTQGGAQAPLVAHAREGAHAIWLYLDPVKRGQLRALANWYTLVFRPVYAAQGAARPPSAIRADLLKSLAQNLKTTAYQIDLAPLTQSDRDDVMTAFGQAGWHGHTTPLTGHWYYSVDNPDFATYWRARPTHLQNLLRRKQARFPLDIGIHHHLTEAVWQDYIDVYNASWKPAEGRPDFLRAFADHAAAQGALRLGLARAQGRAIAAQLWTVDHGRAIIHKLAYRTDAAAASPGTQLSHAMFRHALDQDRVTFISYGTGDDAYKRDWVDHRAQLWHLTLIHPASCLGRLKMAALWTSAWITQKRSEVLSCRPRALTSKPKCDRF